jgi:hypothetical protein
MLFKGTDLIEKKNQLIRYYLPGPPDPIRNTDPEHWYNTVTKIKVNFKYFMQNVAF